MKTKTTSPILFNQRVLSVRTLTKINIDKTAEAQDSMDVEHKTIRREQNEWLRSLTNVSEVGKLNGNLTVPNAREKDDPRTETMGMRQEIRRPHMRRADDARKAWRTEMGPNIPNTEKWRNEGQAYNIQYWMFQCRLHK